MIPLAAAGLLLVLLASVWLGPTPIDPSTALLGLIGQAPPGTDALLIAEVRIPRTLVAALVGAGMGVAGSVMRTLARNPLAGPDLLGLNAGATAALAITVVLAPHLGNGVLALVSMAGGAAGVAGVLLLARLVPGGSAPDRLVVIGAAAAAVIGSLTTTLVYAVGMQNDLLFWLVGGLGTVSRSDVLLLAVLVAAGLVASLSVARDLDAAGLGEEVATSLGVDRTRLRVVAGVAVLLSAGGALAVAGPVPFVGLLAPAIAAGMGGARLHAHLAASALIGAFAVVAADTAGRLVTTPDEKPPGLFLAFAGGLWLVIAVHRRLGRGAA